MAQYRRDGEYVLGRIGFVPEGQTERWDEERKDYVEAEETAAVTSPFVVYLPSLRVAFQIRPNLIEPGTFVGNFQALLNEAAQHLRWVVDLEATAQPSWEEWVRRAVRINQVRVQLQRPNPHYPSEELEELFENAKLAAVNMVFNAEEGESVNINQRFVRDAIDHAQEHGAYSAKGEVVEDGEIHEEEWASNRATELERIEVSVDPETGEARREDIRAALEESETAHDAENQ